MGLIKKLFPLTVLLLLTNCQTPKIVEMKQEPQTPLTPTTSTTLQSKSTNSTNTKTQEKISSPSQVYTSIYPITNYMGYYYQNGEVMLVVFPKTIIDEIYEGDYKIIRAR